MKKTEVRYCSCGHYFVGTDKCPKCKAPWLLTTRVMVAVSRTAAKIIAEDCRANGNRAVRFHVGGRFDAGNE